MAHRIVGGNTPSKDRRRSTGSSEHAKDVILAGIRSGMTVKRACEIAQRTTSTFAYYKKSDASFRKLAEDALMQRDQDYDPGTRECPEFPEFCEQYLGTRLFNHHLQWLDLLEGHEPRGLHPAQRYVPGDPDLVLINTPPEHAKSTTITVNYVTWRICQDPNIRVIIISKTQVKAKEFLLSIKERLAESDTYSDLQTAFAPVGGFSEGAQWAADRIYVAGRAGGEKDPTVQAIGIGGHLYGSRADLVVMDDCVDQGNHQDYVKQINWIQNIVQSRVSAGGRILLVGTRMETADLYSEILKPEYYSGGSSPWTYLTQPAVLEYAEAPKDWVTLWPATNREPVTVAERKVTRRVGDGLWVKWDGDALADKRRRVGSRNWSLVYQQEQVADDATFKQEAVQGCIDRARYPGRLMPGQSGHRQYGMEGLTVIAGVDPAAAGYTAIHVWGLDRQTGTRWVLEVVNKRGMPPHELRSEFRRLTERYGVSEWRIEKNAYQASIVQDRITRDYLNGRGVLISGHTTDSKKWDSDFGVASMSTLFDGWQEGRNLIRLPSQTQSEAMRAFTDQLCSWFPATKGLTDTVMAAWFVEIRCRELMQNEGPGWHSDNTEFMSQRDREGQMVVDLEMALAQGSISAWDGSFNGFSSGLN